MSALPGDLPRSRGERATFRAIGHEVEPQRASCRRGPLPLASHRIVFASTGTWTRTIDRVRWSGQSSPTRCTASAPRRQLSSTRRDPGPQRTSSAENVYLRRGDPGRHLRDVVGRVRPSSRVEHISQVALRRAPSPPRRDGTGKSSSPRRSTIAAPQAKAFIKVNCAALPASLIETELLGPREGRFHGAIAAHPGRFELRTGTLIPRRDRRHSRWSCSRSSYACCRTARCRPGLHPLAEGGLPSRRGDQNQGLERAMDRRGASGATIYYAEVFPIRDPAPARAEGRHPADRWASSSAGSDALAGASRRSPQRDGRALARTGGNVRELRTCSRGPSSSRRARRCGSRTRCAPRAARRGPPRPYLRRQSPAHVRGVSSAAGGVNGRAGGGGPGHPSHTPALPHEATRTSRAPQAKASRVGEASGSPSPRSRNRRRPPGLPSRRQEVLEIERPDQASEDLPARAPHRRPTALERRICGHRSARACDTQSHGFVVPPAAILWQDCARLS